jgi:hypothetical protein
MPGNNTPIPPATLLEAIARGLVNGATFGTAPKIIAAGDATVPVDAYSSRAPTWQQRYAQNLALQQQLDQRAMAAHPVISSVAGFVGNGVSPINRLLPMAPKPSALDAAANLVPMTVQDAQDPRSNSSAGQYVRNLLSLYFRPSASVPGAAGPTPDSSHYTSMSYGGD